MRTVRLMTCAVLAVLVMCVGVHAGIYLEQEVKMPAGSGMPAAVVKQACYISESKMRVESDVMGVKGITIQRRDKGVISQLMPAQKIWMEMPIPKQAERPPAQQLQVTVTKTDETAKIGQWTCSRYDVTVVSPAAAGQGPQPGAANSQSSKYWVTEEVDLGDEMPNYWKTTTMAARSELGQQLSKMKGFPIRMEMLSPRGAVVVTVITVKKRDIPDSMFEVPEGYQKMSMPTAPQAPPR